MKKFEYYLLKMTVRLIGAILPAYYEPMQTKLRILVDTNFFINVDADQGRAGRPAHESLDNVAIELFAVANRHGATLCLASATKEDLMKGHDYEAMVKKMAKYEIVGGQLKPDADFWQPLGPPSTPGTNNYTDDCILNILRRDAVHLLITSDGGIRRKAVKLGLSDRVCTPQECLELLVSTYEPGYKIMHEVAELHLSDIPLSQPFFDSLKADYDGFEDWYARKSREGITAWCVGPPDDLHGIAIYDPANMGFNGEMKVCTFKIAEDQRGEKLGELLTKQVLNTACRLNKNRIYVETGLEKNDVISWFEGYGFARKEVVDKPDGTQQLVMERKVKPAPQNIQEMTPVDLMKSFYPYCALPPRVRAFIVPIQPRYAEMLFSDSLPQSRLPMAGSISDRAIKKVYVSNSGIKKIEQGDVLFFYVSNSDKIVPTQAIVTMGVVDDILRTTSEEALLGFVGKRSVYAEKELEVFLRSDREALAVKFWHIDRIGSPIDLSQIQGISAPQTFATIGQESYNEIARQANLQ